MKDLAKLSKHDLVEHFVRSHDAVRNQASRYANAMGAPGEAVEKATFDQNMKNCLDAQNEIRRRIP